MVKPTDNPPPLLLLPPLEVRPREAARMLGISERQVRRLCELGELTRVGTGRAARINYTSVLAYHERRKECTP